MVVAGAGFHDIGLHDEGVLRDVGGAGFEAGNDFDPVAIALAEFEDGDFIDITVFHEDHVPIAEGLERVVADGDGNFPFLDDQSGVDE